MRWSYGKIPYLLLTVLLLLATTPETGRSSVPEPDALPDTVIPTPPEDDVDPLLSSSLFIQNRGQLEEGVLFYAPLPSGRISFMEDGIILTILDPRLTLPYDAFHHDKGSTYQPNGIPQTGRNVKITFPGSGGAIPVGMDRVPWNYNFFQGSDPERWRTDVPVYKRVVLSDLWGGIDLIYHFDGGHLKYDMIVPPGWDHNIIRIHLEGHLGMSITDAGSLSVSTGTGAGFTDSGLYVFHEGDPERPLAAEFVMIDDDTYSFHVKGRDDDRTLVIDPLVYSTYLGGSGSDTGRGIAVDSSGSTYITGSTESTNYPLTSGCFDNVHNGMTDVFVTKISKDGSSIAYSTFVGGSDGDEARNIAIDGQGNAYVTGFTRSTDFPTTGGAFQEDLSNNYDAFAFKLGTSGASLEYSTYVGGSGSEYSYGIAVDGNGSAYITGRTDSANYPTTSGSYSTLYNEKRDVFVTKIGPNGTYLEYSTYVGGSEFDVGYDIALDHHGNAYVTGYTESSDFPSAGNPYDASFNGATDAFAFKLHKNGTSLVYSTFLGGMTYDYGNGITVDSEGYAYIVGETRSFDFPTTSGAYDTTYNGDLDVFVSKLAQNGRSLLSSTYVGGASADRAYDVAEDGFGSVYITGLTSSSGFPTTIGAYKTGFQGGTTDSFITKLNSALSGLVFSTFIGGSGDDCGWALSLDPSWNVFITGDTTSTSLGTSQGAFQTAFGGGSMDAFALAMRSPPGAIIDLTAVAGEDYVRLQWAEPASDGGSPIINYRIYRRSASQEKALLDTIGKLEAYMDNDVAKGVTYHYCVSAVNNVGESPHSPEVIAMPASRPSEPLNLYISAYGDGMLELKWDPPADTGGMPITQYRLRRTSEGDVLLRNLTAPRSGFGDAGLVNGVQYEYRLSAVNMIGESPLSDMTSGVPRTLPGSPIWVNLTAGPGFILLVWNPPEDDGGGQVMNYHVHRGLVGGMLELHANLTSSVNSYNDTGVENGITYRYRISCVNAEGSSVLSDERSAKPEAPPSAPKNLSAYPSSRTVRLTWESPDTDGGSRILGYRIFGRSVSDEFTLMGSVGRGVFEFTNGSLMNGVVYSFYITSTNSVGESPPSEEVSAKPLSVPSPPRDLNVVSGDGMVTLEWAPPLDIGGAPIMHFVILRGWTQAGLVNLVNVTPDTRSYIDEDVENGLTYYYAVKAVNEAGISLSSESLSAVPEGLPDPPSAPTVTAGRGFVEIRWGTPQNNGGAKVTEIRIYRRSAGSDFVLRHSTTALQGLFKDDNVTNGRPYDYRLTSVNRNGEGPPTDLLSAMPTGLPSAPESLRAELSEGMVLLEWDPPASDGGSQIVTYNVYRALSSENRKMIATLDPNTTSYTDADPSEGLNVYEITALNVLGEGPASNRAEVTFTIEVKTEEDGPGIIIIIAALAAVAVLIIIVVVVVLLARKKKGSPEHTPEEAPPEETPIEAAGEVPPEQPPEEDYLSDFYTNVEQEEMPDNVFNLEEARIEGEIPPDPPASETPAAAPESISENP